MLVVALFQGPKPQKKVFQCTVALLTMSKSQSARESESSALTTCCDERSHGVSTIAIKLNGLEETAPSLFDFETTSSTNEAIHEN